MLGILALFWVGSCCALFARSDTPTAPHHPKAAERVARVLKQNGLARTVATGSGRSMAPIYGDGTVLLYEPVDYDELEAGMVVAFRDDQGRHVTHELITRSGYGWISKGRGNRRRDSGRVTRDNLIGVVYLVLYTSEDAPVRPPR